ncbi:CPCC family cysteine-rich protein [Amycolatopsis carbonis]|uniref:CPCC family cysteine-rich protein n=1 Tax=Amycolatopsis carbonis TaxID=715471 RepID=A0A9Y2IN78_9PSEU|nr:CPCC family cysteine-rich protein [Amycolatopsis sp. 2-15]WIX83450.1 CPCC family cysteine-rich protein [Amycolatopsis sp. 2-15]
MFEEQPGSHAICAVCFWEDDAIQLRWPDWSGGANRPSLIESQHAYAELGAMEGRFTGLVGTAAASGPVDDGWRLLNLAVDNLELRGDHGAPWPADGTRLYWWRPNCWRRS